MLEMPKIKYNVDVDSLTASDTSDSYPEAVKLLMAPSAPPHHGLTGAKKDVTIDGEKKTLSTVAFHGLVTTPPDPEDPPDQRGYDTELWETLEIAGKQFVPSSKFSFLVSQLESITTPAHGRDLRGMAGCTTQLKTKQAEQAGMARQNVTAAAVQGRNESSNSLVIQFLA